jgi:hypothetical protein
MLCELYLKNKQGIKNKLIYCFKNEDNFFLVQYSSDWKRTWMNFKVLLGFYLLHVVVS